MKQNVWGIALAAVLSGVHYWFWGLDWWAVCLHTVPAAVERPVRGFSQRSCSECPGRELKWKTLAISSFHFLLIVNYFILWFCPYATVSDGRLSFSHRPNLFFISTANWCILSGDRFLNGPCSGVRFRRSWPALFDSCTSLPVSLPVCHASFSPRVECVFCVICWKTSMTP